MSIFRKKKKEVKVVDISGAILYLIETRIKVHEKEYHGSEKSPKVKEHHNYAFLKLRELLGE